MSDAKSIAVAFGEGLSAPWVGFRYMSRHPALWRYGVVLVLLTTAVTGAVLLHRQLAGCDDERSASPPGD